jgi:mycothione reductase
MQHYDLIIVGAGSGNMVPTDAFGSWKIAIVESDRFGGTCLNRGCIPSKMFVYAADVATTIRHSERFGVHSELTGVDWPAIRERVFGRIDPIHERGVEYRRSQGIDVYLGPARFTAPYELAVDGVALRGDRIVVAAGTRPAHPPIPGLDDVPHHTSDTIMRIDDLPRSMLVLGGGYIGAEMSHVFGALGTRITIVHRGDELLPSQDREVRHRFTAAYRERFDLRLATTVQRVEPSGVGLVAHLATRDGTRSSIEVETMLVAIGRVPNTDELDAAAGGLELDEHGHIRSDDTYATNLANVWALGDTTNHYQLKHMANAEARLVQHNIVHADAPRRAKFPFVPAAVFADPQVATVGATEDELDRAGRTYRVAVREYSTTAYGWAMEDTTGFVKLLSDPATGLLLGAHIMGAQASTLIQPLIQAMTFGNTVEQVARDVIYIHPALTEVVENALLDLL